MHSHRFITLTILAAAACLGLAAAELPEATIQLPRPILTAVNQPISGRSVALELGTGPKAKLLVPVADVHLWKGNEDDLSSKTSLALRDNGWSVGLIRFADDQLVAVAEARLQLPMGGVSRPGSGRFSVHRMLVPWKETATWSSSGHAEWSGPRKGKDYESTAIASLQLDDPQGGKRLVVIDGMAELVSGWADGSVPNHGIILRFDGKALQTSVRTRENLTGSSQATLGQGAACEIRWHAGLFDRLLTAPEDLRDITLDIELKISEENLGGTLEAVAKDSVVASITPTEAGTQRVTLNGLRSTALGTVAQLRWSGAGTVSIFTGGKRGQRPEAQAIIVDQPATQLFPRETPFRDGVFVTVVDGHLTYGGERLRLWGTMGYGSKERLRNLGYNAYRLWGPNTQKSTTPTQTAEYGKRGELPPSTKGDNSSLDKFDRAYAECREQGLWVMATFLMRDWIPGAELPGSFVDDGGDFAEWAAALKEGKGDPSKLTKYLGMVDERMALVRERATSQILERVNPYTGIRYAEDEIIAIHELANEKRVVKDLLEGKLRKLPKYFQAKFDASWMDFLRQRYPDQAALTAVWGELKDGEALDGAIALAPLQKERKGWPEARAADVVRFICERHMAFLSRIRDHARSHAPEGVGVAVTPFSFDTQYQPHTPWAYANSGGDVQNFGMYFWNYGSDLTKPPSLYVMDQTSVANKPTVIYETNRGRPSPHRSEYPFMAASFGAWQDWDAIFFHYWGGPRDPQVDEQYMVETMSNGNHDHFWTMVIHGPDPVMCASIAAAGQAFLGGYLPSAPDPITVRVGAEAIFGGKHINGIGQAAAAFQRGCRMAFEPDADFAVKWPDDAPRTMPETAVQAGAITWDWPNGRLIVDTPKAKFLIGKTAAHTFADGIAFSGFDLPFAAVALVSADDKDLAVDCRQAWVSATAHAQNSGFDIDLTGKLGGPFNQIKARRSEGHAPVIVDKVGFTIALPSAASGELIVHDFARRERMRQAIDSDGAVRLHGHEQFLGLLHITSRGAAREAAVDALQIVVDEAEQAKRTQPSRAGLWFPLAGLNWDTDAERAIATLGKQGLTVRSDGEHVVIDAGQLLLDSPAVVKLSYSFQRMTEVSAELTAAPTWNEAVASLSKQFGQPKSQKRGTQFEGSRAVWAVARDGGTFPLELIDVQGVISLSLTPPASTP
ncbi:MAG: hypothetical protein PF961_07105 [Planctomycetota bacterium]|jgi:hypothetical protein|nr:hypothetical protein [Planctomycetota bacterium]